MGGSGGLGNWLKGVLQSLKQAGAVWIDTHTRTLFLGKGFIPGECN